MAPTGRAKGQRNPQFCIELENGGIIRGELYPRFAPQTVGNFIALANGGFYDGTSFHRCLRDFVVQCGRGEGKQPYRIRGEFEFNGFPQNALAHEPGTLSMSRGTGYDSACSQFFIVVSDDERELACLDGAYAAFGRVTEGLAFAEALSRCPTNACDEPLRRQGIARVRVSDYGRSYPFERLPPLGEPSAQARESGRRIN